MWFRLMIQPREAKMTQTNTAIERKLMGTILTETIWLTLLAINIRIQNR